MYKRIISLFLCLLMVLGIALPVFAEEPKEEITPPAAELKIFTVEEFLSFAAHCRLDAYSQNLTVTLEANLDMGGTDFHCIPHFSGSFDGKGHTISGLSLTADGSIQGLFRYLTATAVVKDLTVRGTIQPGGSRNIIGAMAGENAGKIQNCTVLVTVSGSEHVGGLVGRNDVTGVIENCHAAGEIHGDHFVGGIAGENRGVIRNCSSKALVNTTPQQNSVEISDITMDTLTNTETASTVTDIGGIAGLSSGVIRECQNYGNVGYRHMGYNIGGIAGVQSGYIADCENHGAVHGRKEVGGIIGQMEPASLIEFSADTLQILQEQLGTMSGLVNRASSNAQTNASQVSGQIGMLQDQAQTAREAVDTLFSPGSVPPDSDEILAAQSTLSATLNAMPGTLQSIAYSTQATINGLTRDLNAISRQIGAMKQTIDDAAENLGGSITDISDQDTPEILTGKVENCINHGDILADLNVGGIAGAMAVENDMDFLEDWEQYGEESLNFQSEVRAVVLRCENHGRITGKKQNVGGITGWQSLGLVKNCANAAVVDGAGADYVGGISGQSAGFIRSNYAKCEIYASAYAGGIAGSATIVTDCMAQANLLGVKEKLGAILGEAVESRTLEVAVPVSGNIYPVSSRDVGAIDGISYVGLAQPMPFDEFLSLEELPDLFHSVTVTFLLKDGTKKQVSLPAGGKLQSTQIPPIPEKEGFAAHWEDMEQADLDNVLFDMTFEAIYVPYRTTIQSEQRRENGLPLLLAEGAFTAGANVAVAQSDTATGLPGEDTILEIWDVAINEPASTVRFLLPETPGNAKLYVCSELGVWQQVPCRADGSYLVFDTDQCVTGIALAEAANHSPALYAAAVCAAALLIAAVAYFQKKKCHPASPQSNANP